jgi:hypothetical protein
MNTQTTTASRFAVDSTGTKFELPENFLSASDRNALRSMIADETNLDDAIREIASHMEDILANGGQITTQELNSLWCDACEAFRMEKGREIEEEIGLYLAPDEKGQEAKKEIQIHTLNAEEINQINGHLERNTFEPRPGEVYASAMFGACSSRRCGITAQTWVSRMMERATSWRMDNRAEYYNFVVYIAKKAYTMPVNELVR